MENSALTLRGDDNGAAVARMGVRVAQGVGAQTMFTAVLATLVSAVIRLPSCAGLGVWSVPKLHTQRASSKVGLR